MSGSNSVRFHRIRPTGRTWCGKWDERQLGPPGGEYPDGARNCGNCDRIFELRGGQAGPPE